MITVTIRRPKDSSLSDKDHTVFSLLTKQWYGSGAANTDPSEVSPVKQIRQPLSSVPLNNAVATRLLAEAKHELSQLVTGLISWTESPVHNVNTWKWHKEMILWALCVCVFALQTVLSLCGQISMVLWELLGFEWTFWPVLTGLMFFLRVKTLFQGLGYN